MRDSIESILTRSVSILSKFITLTFLAKVLTLSDYGSYQLISYFIVISVYLYGLEYYMYGNREVAKGEDRVQKINNHINFYITVLPINFLFQLGILFYLIPSEILNLDLIALITVINFCEYFNQEVYRYLVMIKKIRKANLLLFMKAILFLILVVVFDAFFGDLDINAVVYIMFFSYLMLLIFSMHFFLKNLIARKEITFKFVDLKLLKKTFKYLFPFIGMAIFTKGVEFFDKFAIDYFYGTENVGIYAFLFSIASLIYIFITSGFYIIYMPELIRLHKEKSPDLKAKLQKYAYLVTGFSIILIFGILVTIEYLLKLIGKVELLDNINLLYPLLGAYFLLNLSTIPNLVLYIDKKDKELMKIKGVILVFNVIANLFLLKYYNIYGAAIALLLTYLVNLILTSYKGIKVWKQIT